MSATDPAPYQHRHPSVASTARFLVDVNPNLPRPLMAIADRFALLTHDLLTALDDSPELAVALRKILEAKDAAARAAL